MTSAFTPKPEMLRIHDLHAFYGESHILHGIDLTSVAGECVTLLGRNGSGRSTTLKSILGLVGRRTGRSWSTARSHCRAHPPHGPLRHRLCARGAGHLRLAVHRGEPDAAAAGGQRRHVVEEIYGMFPNLLERAAARAPSFPVASSRCWRWRASCALAPSCCCSTRSPRAWPR
jgi:branched-chain amino acid transport system ATP-binding protein